MNSDEAAVLVDNAFGPDVVWLPPVFGGPFSLCGWCHNYCVQWTMIQGQPAPMHKRCVEPWLLHESGVEVEAREIHNGQRTSDGRPIIPEGAMGVYAKWANRQQEEVGNTVD